MVIIEVCENGQLAQGCLKQLHCLHGLLVLRFCFICLDKATKERKYPDHTWKLFLAFSDSERLPDSGRWLMGSES